MSDGLAVQRARVGDDAAAAAPPFERVNPHIAARLRELNLDRTFVRAKGPFLWDRAGARYLDLTSQYGVLALGHNPERVVARVARALAESRPIFCQPSCSAEAAQLAQALLAHASWPDGFCTFTNSGAESIEAAVKLARCCSGRRKVVNFTGAFHGKTTGALALTANPHYREPYLLDESWVVTLESGDGAALTRVLESGASEIAAVVLEPVMGEGGVLVHSPEFVRVVNERCRAHGVLLIADEVQTGLGRLGTMLGSRAVGLEPDVVCLAKALGGGVLPIGAVLSRPLPGIERFHETHSSTFAGNGLACVAALATLDEIGAPGFLARVAEQGRWLLQQVEEVARRHPDVVREVRGVGLLIGIELRTVPAPRATPLFAACAEQGALALLLASYMANVEQIRLLPSLNGGNTIRVQPPLNVDRPALQQFLAALERALAVFDRQRVGPIVGPALGAGRPSASASRDEARQRHAFADRLDRYDFAFVGHPLHEEDYARFEPSLAPFDGGTLRRVSELANGLDEPFWGGNFDVELCGRALTGCFLVVPMVPAEMMKQRAGRALALVRKAVDRAAALGARHVGLGAFSSIVTAGGALIDADAMTITNGNSLTAVAALRQALAALGPRRAIDCRALVVGGFGSVGQKLILLAAREFGHLTVVGNPDTRSRAQALRLRSLVRAIARAYAPVADELPEGSVARAVLRAVSARDGELPADAVGTLPLVVEADLAQSLATHDVAFLAANCTRAFLDASALSSLAVVIDVARPLSVRPGVPLPSSTTYLPGGMVTFAGAPDLRDFGVDESGVYSCLGEVILLSHQRIATRDARGVESSLEYLVSLDRAMDRLGVTPA